MRSVVSSFFVGFTGPLEGVVNFLYCDILGLVTTAIGVLCDSPAAAQGMPFLRPDGTRATREEIAADWHRVKARQDMKMRGGMAYKTVAQLRLSPDGVAQVTLQKLGVMEVELKKRFPDFESWPADAQMATLSMSWACGPWFKFPALERALLARDFTAAAASCHINTDGPDGKAGTLDDNRGVIPRNVANKAMYRNAAMADRRGLDPDILFFPSELDPGPGNAYDPTTIIGYQKALALLGYELGKADGFAGPKTIAAVKQFQSDRGLVVDGRVGPKTQSAMLEELRKQKGI